MLHYICYNQETAFTKARKFIDICWRRITSPLACMTFLILYLVGMRYVYGSDSAFDIFQPINFHEKYVMIFFFVMTIFLSIICFAPYIVVAMFSDPETHVKITRINYKHIVDSLESVGRHPECDQAEAKRLLRQMKICYTLYDTSLIGCFFFYVFVIYAFIKNLFRIPPVRRRSIQEQQQRLL
jgi:hypothetical protein